MVSWFRGSAHSHILVIKMTVGFAVSWFSCFIHYCRFRGFEVSWFRLLCLWVIKITIGFMVWWFHPLPTLGLQNDCKFHGFVVSLFCALLFWNIVMKIRDGEDETKKPRNLSSSDVPYSLLNHAYCYWVLT